MFIMILNLMYYIVLYILDTSETVLNVSISYTSHEDHLLRGMAVKLIGTFIEVILKNNFGEFKVQNNDMISSNVVITDLINIITQVYFINYFIEYSIGI